MKFSELYQNIKSIVENISPSASDVGNPVKGLYVDYALEKLFWQLRQAVENGDRGLTRDNVIPLEALYADYFAVVKGTPFIACYDLQSRMTLAYFALAGYLAPVTGRSPYEYMFPTVNVVDYAISGMSLRDDTLHLTDFVLSDENDSVIEVLACLGFAENDAVLKHTRLFDGQVRLLSEAECERVIRHSDAAYDYWCAIQDKVDIEQGGADARAALIRLVNFLAKGGEHGGRDGQELNSGADANVGIQEFFAWFDTLNEEDRLCLRAMTAPSLSATLGELFDRLATPQAVDLADIWYCVELIGGNINRIIECHPELSDIPAKSNAAEPTSLMLMQAQTQVNYRRNVLQRAMRDCWHYPVIARGDLNRFYSNVAKLTDLQACLGEKMKVHFPSVSRVVHFLKKIAEEHRAGFLLKIKNVLLGFSYEEIANSALRECLPNDEKKARVIEMLSVLGPLTPPSTPLSGPPPLNRARASGLRLFLGDPACRRRLNFDPSPNASDSAETDFDYYLSF